MNCSLPGSAFHGDSPGKTIRVGCHGIFPTQESNPVSHIAGGFVTIWATRKAQEYWSGYPIPLPGKLPDSGIELGSPALQADSLPAKLPGKYKQTLKSLHKYSCGANEKWMKVLAAQLGLTLATAWTIACQARLSMEFSRQEYWCG